MIKREELSLLKRRLRDRLTGEDELAQNRALIIAENCANSIQANLVGGNFFTGLFLLLDATTVQIGLVNIVIQVCSMFQLISPMILERFRTRKRLLIFSRATVYILNIVMMGIAANLPIETRSRVYIMLGLQALLNAVSACTSPGFSVWHIQSIPDRERAHYFSVNQRLSSLLSNGLILIGGFVTDAFTAHGQKMLGLMVLRGAALCFACLDIRLLSRIREYPYPETKPPRLRELVTEPFREKRYLQSVLIVFLWNLFATTTGSYYSVYLLSTLNYSYGFLNLNAALYVPVLLLLAPLWARYINRTSWLAVFWKALLLYGAFYCLYPFVTEGKMWVYVAVNLLNFVMSPAINLVTANMSFYNIPRKNQTIYLSFCSTSATVAAVLGNVYATQFMLRTEGRRFELFGVPMQNNQFMPFVTGLLIMFLGVIVFFINQKEKNRLSKTEEQ